MKRTHHLFFTITNDPNFDQRMIRICTSLAAAGFRVTLVGRGATGQLPLREMPYRQKRLRCFLSKGAGMYAEFNLRLFFYLLFKKVSLICAIDLDTIIPAYCISKLKNIPRVYDAHELFCEMKEVVTRPFVYRCWKTVERIFVPRFPNGYTVNGIIAREFQRMYLVDYLSIRNMPRLTEIQIPEKPERYILYQGAVNEGRSFETLIPAMRQVNARLIICGDGNFMQQARKLVRQLMLEHKIIFTGKLLPHKLSEYTQGAYIGVTLFENTGLSNYYSLANRFFDYMHAGVPQLCVDYPVYREIIAGHPFAELIADLSASSIAGHLNKLLEDDNRYSFLQQNCLAARNQLNWQQEEQTLVDFYRNVLIS